MKFYKIFLALALAVSLASCGQKQAEFLTGEADGAEIDVGVKIPGRIEKVLVKEGDTVSKGTVLAKLESKEINAKLETAEAALKEAKEQFSFASKSYERVAQLYRTQVLPQQQYDETKYKYEAARQKVSATEGVLKEVRAYLDELELKAPIDGEITEVVSREGEIVAAGYPVFTLLNPKDQWVVVNVREDRLPGIEKGKNFKVYFPALDKTYDMKVSYISALASFAKWKATNETGSFDLKTFEVRLRPENPISEIHPGMTAVIK